MHGMAQYNIETLLLERCARSFTKPHYMARIGRKIAIYWRTEAMPEVIFHHVCIQTNTYEESLRFYCDLLDMKIVKETAGFHGRAYNTWLQKDRFAIELQTPKGDQTFDPINSGHAGLAHLCFWVENVETACRALQAKNITDFHFA